MLKILKNKIAPFVYVSLFFVKDLPTGQAFSSGPPTRISIIPNKYEVTEKDTLCLSSPSIESLPAIAPLFLRVANFHSHFLRSTAAAIVTALLFMLTSLPALAADGDFFLQGNNGQTDPRKAKAMKQVVDLKTFQDSKLDACIDRGKDWEQCFLFGDSVSPATNNGDNGRRTTNPLQRIEDTTIDINRPRRKPPTW